MLSAKNTNPGVGIPSGLAAGRGFLDAVVAVLHSRTGVNFADYRAAMLERRIANQMAASGAAEPDEYLKFLRSSPGEPFRLLERITIKVSRFYRHAPAFDHLRDVVLPALERARGGEPLRIWCAGCGAGEEAYTLAMLLDQSGIQGTVDATDIDSSALNEGRAGIYTIRAAAELPAALVSAYLEPVVANEEPCYTVADSLRGRVRFAYHDVTSDAPPLHGFDLVSCRNVLIYLQRPAQVRATSRLVDTIRDDGVLCLGEAEWPPPELADRLEPFAHKTRLFRKRAQSPFTEDNELNRSGRLRPCP